MRNKGRIQLDREIREEMIAEIIKFFKDEREEEIGRLASDIVLDFIVDRLAPEFYNQGVMDSRRYMGERVEDLQSLMR